MLRDLNNKPFTVGELIQRCIAAKHEFIKTLKESNATQDEIEREINVITLPSATPADECLMDPEFDYLRYSSGILIVGAMVAKKVPTAPGAMRRDTICGYGCEALFDCLVTSLNNARDSAKINPGRHIEVNINSARHVEQEFMKTIPKDFPANDHICMDLTMSRSPVSNLFRSYQ